MSILQRPGWGNRELIEEAVPRLGTEVRSEFEKKFHETGAGKVAGAGSPQVEFWKFIAAVIFKNDQLREYWPMVVNTRGELNPRIKASDISAVAEQPEGEQAIELLKSEAAKAFASAETFEEVNSSVHWTRRAKSTAEHAAYKGGFKGPHEATPAEFENAEDTREKAQKLARLQAKVEGRPFETKGPSDTITDRPPTDEELINADRAMFKFTMAPLLAKIPVRAKHSYADSFFDDEEEADNITVLDAMGDYPQLIDALFDSGDVYEFMDKIAALTHDSDQALSDIAQQIFSHIKTKLIKGAEEIIDDAAAKATTNHPFMDVGSLTTKKKEQEKNQEDEELSIAKKQAGNLAEIQRATKDFWAKRGENEPPVSRTEIVGSTPSKFREDVKLTSKQTDQLLQEKYVKTRQYLAAMEEQFRQR